MYKTSDLQKVEIPCELHINLEQVLVFEILRLGVGIGGWVRKIVFWYRWALWLGQL